jgi:hypothetical protein
LDKLALMASTSDASASAEPKTFDEAVSRFQIFLSRNGYSERLIWVLAADLIFPGGKSVYVKVPVPERNLADPRNRFTHGMTDGFGVRFSTVCEMGGETYCHVWAPRNRKEQEYGFVGKGLKLLVQTNHVIGMPVGSWLRWRFLLIRHRSGSALKQELFP